jgi:hypothetical protein
MIANFRFLAIVFFVLLLSGCGSGNDGRLAVKGTVSYGGEPIKQGSITLRPTDSTQSEVSAAIVDGAYEIPAQLGPKAAEYIVKVVAFRMKKDARAAYTPSYLKDSATSDPNAGMVPEQYIPKKHNDDSKLKVTFDAAQPTYDFKLDK